MGVKVRLTGNDMKKSLGGISIAGFLSIVLLAHPGLVRAAYPPPKVTLEEAPLSPEVKARTSFAPVIKKAAPSVVNISSSMTIHERGSRSPLSDDPFFHRFFGDDSGDQAQPRDRKAQSLGSGVIV